METEVKKVEAALNGQDGLLNTLQWELFRNETEFQIVADQSELENPAIAMSPGMRDVMLAEVKMLGHRDKYPLPYQWESLLPALRQEEEILWIVSKKRGQQSFALYFGVKFNRVNLGGVDEIANREERFQILSDQFTRCIFPESRIERIKSTSLERARGRVLPEVLRDLSTGSEEGNVRPLNEIFCVTGMPSPKDQDAEKIIGERRGDARPYSSLNTILEPHLNVESPFTIVFTISPATSTAIEAAFREKFKLRDAIRPLTQMEVNRTKSTSWGDNVNITVQRHRNAVQSAKVKFFGDGPDYARWRPFVCAVSGAAVGATSGAFVGASSGNPVGVAVGAGVGLGVGLGVNVANVIGGMVFAGRDADRSSYIQYAKSAAPDSTSITTHSDESESEGRTLHFTRSDLVFVDKHLEKGLEHLQQSLSGGGYYATAMVYTDKHEVGESVARMIRASLTGSHSYLRPMQIFNLKKPEFFQLRYNLPIATILSRVIHYEVLNCNSACMALMLPDADLPDNIKLKKSVFYARPEQQQLEGVDCASAADFGKMAYFENQLRFDDSPDLSRNLLVSDGDLLRHVFVVGAPGGGKSYRVRHVLNSLPSDLRLVVLETAKREYGEYLHRKGKDLIRYTLGNSRVFPLRINPFYFDPGTDLKQHIAVLVDAISDLLPMEALIGPKLREAVENCYRRCGWNIENNMALDRASDVPPYPNMLMFNSEVAKICEGLSDYGPEVRSNYTGALKNRAAIFLDDVYQDIFSHDGNRPIDEIFPPYADVVVEMEDMPPSELNMPAFIISILLQRLRAYRFLKQKVHRKLAREGLRSGADPDRFVVAIEEAHNILSRKIEESRGDERQSGKGARLLDQVSKILAEGRGIGLGVMVIDQSAHAVAPSVLADTNTKVVFRVENGDELKTIGTSIGLEEKDWPDMGFLGTGECIVKNGTTPLPIKLACLEDGENGETAGCLIASASQTDVPYAQCAEMFDAMFRSGVLRRSVADRVAQSLVVKRFADRREFLHYVWGRYLFSCHRGEMLDAHLDGFQKWVEHAHHDSALTDYYRDQFLRFAANARVDAFLRFLDKPNGCPKAQLPLVESGCRLFFREVASELDDQALKKIETCENAIKKAVCGLYEKDDVELSSTIRNALNKVMSVKDIESAWSDIRSGQLNYSEVNHSNLAFDEAFNNLFNI